MCFFIIRNSSLVVAHVVIRCTRITLCIGKIRIMGFINPPWKARDDNPVDYLVHKKQLALPYNILKKQWMQLLIITLKHVVFL